MEKAGTTRRVNGMCVAGVETHVRGRQRESHACGAVLCATSTNAHRDVGLRKMAAIGLDLARGTIYIRSDEYTSLAEALARDGLAAGLRAFWDADGGAKLVDSDGAMLSQVRSSIRAEGTFRTRAGTDPSPRAGELDDGGQRRPRHAVGIGARRAKRLRGAGKGEGG